MTGPSAASCPAPCDRIFIRCWFIHALRCSETGARDADIVVVSSQLVTAGIYKMIKRAGQHAHRFTFQEFAAVFAACSSSSQGLTSGNATRHLCSSLLEPSDYRISDATSQVALTYKAVEHLRSLLHLRHRSALRIIAACVSSSAAASVAAVRSRVAPASPAAVDVVSDTSDTCALRSGAAAAADDDDGSASSARNGNQVKRQLAFVDSAPETSSSPSRQSAAVQAVQTDDCFNDDGSPIVPQSHTDFRKQESVLLDEEEDQLHLQLQQLDQNLLQKQQQQHSPKPPANPPLSAKPARPSSPSAAFSVSPSLAARASAPSASPLLPSSSALSNVSSPTFPDSPSQHEKKAPKQRAGGQQRLQQQQPQMSASHQALIDEAVQAARLQVTSPPALVTVPG